MRRVFRSLGPMKPFVIAILLGLSSRAVAQERNSRPPIIDVHLHAFDQDFLTFQQRPEGYYEEYRDRTLQLLEEFNVIAVAGGPAETVRSWKSLAPDRIISGYMSYDIVDRVDRFEADSIRAMHRRGEIEMIGEVLGQYMGLAPSDPHFDSLWEIAEELQLPIGYHMGFGGEGVAYHTFPKYRAALGNPLLFEDVLVRHPTLRLYIMHAGWPMLSEMQYLLAVYPNVYVGVGSLEWMGDFPIYLKGLIDAGFEDRIMFGSDQMSWPDRIESSLAAIEGLEFLTDQQKRKILHDNAAKFFDLESSK